MRKIPIYIISIVSLLVTPLLSNGQQQDNVLKKLKETVDSVGCERADQAFQDALNQARELSIERGKILINYGSCLTKTKRYKEAIDMYKEATQILPDPFLAYFGLGTAYLLAGQYTEAAQNMEESIKIKPAPGTFARLSFIHFRMAAEAAQKGDNGLKQQLLKKAEDECRQAIAQSTVPYPIYHGQLAHILEMQGKYDEAINEYNTAIGHIPSMDWNNLTKDATWAEYYVALGRVHVKKGDKQKAMDLIQKGIEKAPTSELKQHLELIGKSALSPAKDRFELEERFPELKEPGFQFAPRVPMEPLR